jgi:ribosomal protein S14
VRSCTLGWQFTHLSEVLGPSNAVDLLNVSQQCLRNAGAAGAIQGLQQIRQISLAMGSQPQIKSKEGQKQQTKGRDRNRDRDRDSDSDSHKTGPPTLFTKMISPAS